MIQVKSLRCTPTDSIECQPRLSQIGKNVFNGTTHENHASKKNENLSPCPPKNSEDRHRAEGISDCCQEDKPATTQVNVIK